MPKVGRRSDSQLYDGSSNNDRVLRNAPFGTTYTPVVRTKIVGGKPRYVLDKESVKEDPRHAVPHTNESQHLMPRQQLQVKNASPRESRTPDVEHYGRPRDHEHPLQVAAAGSSSHTAPAAATAGEKADLTRHAAQRPAWNNRPVLPPIGHGQLVSKNEPRHSPGDYEAGRRSPSAWLEGAAHQFDDSSRVAAQGSDKLVLHSNHGHTGAAAASIAGSGHDRTGIADVHAADGAVPAVYGARRGHDHHARQEPAHLVASHHSPPSQMGKERELGLLRRLGEQLIAPDGKLLLKDAYVELASHDHSLSGWVDYRDIALALMRAKIFIKDEDLREVAAMFISYDHPGRVNYEKLLSYLASTMQHRAASPSKNMASRHAVEPLSSKRRADWPEEREQSMQSQLQEKRRPAQEQAEKQTLLRGDRQSTRQPYAGSQSKLMHVVEEQLMSLDDGLDLEKLRQEFMMADRLQRQTLSHKQIKDIVYRMRIPLQESVINQILDRCQTHGDGQYWWGDFVDFLERVQPVHTGLDIKPSKRPIEYAKHYPAPDSSWPHVVQGASGNGDSDIGGDGSSGYDHYVQPASVRPDATAPPHSDAAVKARSSNDVGQQSNSRRQYAGELPILPPQVTASSPTHRLLHHHHDTTIDDDWFDRFAFLAEALYRSDNKGEGLLLVDEAKWLISKYNDVYQLGLPESSIRETVQRCSRGPSVAIDPVLKSLATATFK